MLTVGLIGFGAIGKDVAQYIKEKKVGDVQLKAILVRSKEKYSDAIDSTITICDDPKLFFDHGLDVVIESAGHDAVYQYGNKSLESGSHFIVVSVGALADPELLQSLEKTAQQHHRKLIVPSAAIAGLDRITAAGLHDIDEITLITRKPPNAWRGTVAESLIDLDSITEPYRIYKGTARESSKMFPESTNVSAALALAGIGFDKTSVHVYVDPTIQYNSHQIIAKGYFGEVEIRVQNTPSESNPKSGYIVAMSICKVLKSFTSAIVIGV
jgi:aspartate dehydrogenase